MWATVCTTEEEGVPGRVHINSQKTGQEAAQLRISICPSTAHGSSSGRQSLDSSQSLRLDRASSVRCFRAGYQSELILQFTETHAGLSN